MHREGEMEVNPQEKTPIENTRNNWHNRVWDENWNHTADCAIKVVNKFHDFWDLLVLKMTSYYTEWNYS